MIQLRGLQSVDSQLHQSLEQCWQRVLARKDVGFPQIPASDEAWQAIEKRLGASRPAKHALVLGIGGSSLGSQVLKQCFGFGRAAELHFLESPDPYSATILDKLSTPEWRDHHVVIVSKSGNTLETLSWVEALAAKDRDWLKNSQVTVVASPGEGPLQQWARRENVPCLWIPNNVGGRFSVLTAASMFPAALMGLRISEFREGAAWALSHSHLSTALSAEILGAWKRGEWITQMWTYSEGLRIFGEWWQQLWGESLAKKLQCGGQIAPRVSTPMACCGPRDQHSLVQQLMEGARDKHIFLTRVKALENSKETFRPRLFPTMPFHARDISLGQIVGAEAQAFERSLQESQIHFATVEVETLEERSVGALFMLWQMTIAQLGEYMNIDAFNQPGVEIGKKYAAQFLASAQK